MILASSMGEYTYQALSKAAVTTLPTAAAARSGARFEAPRCEKLHAKGGRPKRFWRKPLGKGHRVSEVQVDDDKASEEADPRDDPDEEPGSEQDEQSGTDDFDDAEWPEELSHALEEAEAYITQAEKQRAEVEKARGFFREKLQDPKARAEHLRKLKTKMLCSACGGLGHWKDDPE